MEDEPILWCISFCFQRSKQSLLSSQDLHRRGWIFGQIRKRPCMGYQPCSNKLPNQSSQIRGHGLHFILKIGEQVMSILCQRNNPLGKGFDINQINRRDILTHGGLGSIHHLLCLLLITQNFLNSRNGLITQSRLVLDEQGQLGIEVIVCNNLDKLWEMPRVPLSDSHHKRIHIFIQGIQESNRLNNHIIRLVYVEFHLCSGVGVRQTKLSP
mmetsp:Transcript_13642/g.27253  ORF Transcript_13642/g.27253 Transcript_13642/m.27253 type:complete len:212 (-) Transcript_13642:449-1084(-)